MSLQQKIHKIVSQIPDGKFLTYKKVAKLAGQPLAYRAVANILARNRDTQIPCHRVIKSDNLIGGYFGSEKLGWKKSALLLKEGAIGVIPTDTVYGICAPALNKKSVEKVYALKKRDPQKPFIVLINSLEDLKLFGVKINKQIEKPLSRFWPGKTSVILKCSNHKFSYLHRGTKTLAFRLPKQQKILKILSLSGPLVAPSANWEGYKLAKNIASAKKYFGNKVFYLNYGEISGKPSTVIDLTGLPPKILRR